MATVREMMQQARDSDYTDEEISVRFRDLGFIKSDLDLDYKAALDLGRTRRANKQKALEGEAKTLVTNTMQGGLEAAGLTGIELDPDKAKERDLMLAREAEQDRLRGTLKALPAPTVVPQQGGILATGRDPVAERKAQNIPVTDGLPSYERKQLVWDPVGNMVGMAKGAASATLEGTDAAMRAQQKDLAARKKMDYLQAAQVDAAENLSSPFVLLLELAGPRYIDKSKETVTSAAEASGKSTVEGVAGGALSAFEALGQGDVQGILAKPVSLASVAWPGVGATARALPGTAALLKKGAGKVGGAVSKVADLGHRVASANIPRTPVAPGVIRVVGDAIDSALGTLMTEEGRASLKRTIEDGLHQADPRATALVQSIVQDPQNAASSIKTDFERLARRASKEDPESVQVTPEVLAAAEEVVIPPKAADLEAAKATKAAVDEAAYLNMEPIPFTRDNGRVVLFNAGALGENLAELTRIMEDETATPAARAEARRAVETIGEEFTNRQRAPESITPEKIDPANGQNITVEGASYAAEDVLQSITELEARVEAGRSSGIIDLEAESLLPALRAAVDDAGRWMAAGRAVETIATDAEASSPIATAASERLKDLGADLPTDAGGTMGRSTPITAYPPASTVVPHEPVAAMSSVTNALPIAMWRGRLREIAGDVVDNIRTQVEKLDPELAARLKEQGRSIEDEILDAASGALSLEQNTLLRDKGFRDKVSELTAALMGVADPKRFAKHLSETVEEALGKSFAGDAPLGTVQFDGVLAGHWASAFSDVFGSAKTKDLVRGAVATVSENLGRELEKTAMTRGIIAEAERARTPADVVKAVQDGDLVPQILDGSKTPSLLAAEMLELAPGDAKVAAAAKVIAGYERLNGELLGFEGYAKPSIKTSLEAHAGARKAFFSDDILSNVIRMQKRAYVPLNAKSILNNFLSNEAMQFWARANPISSVQRLARAVKFERYLSGKVSDVDAPTYRAIQRTGIVDSNQLAQDIGAVRGLADVGDGVPGVGLLNKILARSFALGDQIFKFDEVLTNFNDFKSYLDKLKPGRTIDTNIGSKKVQFGKNPDGSITVVDKTAVKASSPTVVGGDDLLDLIAGVSANSARSKFIDYSRIPGGLQKLKAGPFRGIGSGFATWMAGAVDVPVPGLGKKGLLHAQLAAPIRLVTNDAGLNRTLARQDMATATRRATMAAIAGSSDTTGAEAQELGAGFNFGLSESRPMSTKMIDPDTAASFDWRGVDYLGPTKMAARVGTSMAMSFAELLRSGDTNTAVAFKNRVAEEGADPRLWSAYTRALYRDASGQAGSPSDVLDLVALSGSTILQTWESIKDTEDAGKVMMISDVMKEFMTPILGSTAASVISLAGEAISEADSDGAPSKSRAATLSDNPADSQTFLRWSIKHILGKGWKEKYVRHMGKEKAYSLYSKLDRELKASLGVTQMEKEGEGMVLKGGTTGNPSTVLAGERRLERAAEIGHVVDEVLFEMFDQLDTKSLERFKADARSINSRADKAKK
jgi:hypothetical protein